MGEFAKLIEKTGIPKGVGKVGPGIGETWGKGSTTHKKVERIAPTGGTETARDIKKNSAEK
jgi:Delta 1-pyrroline-5-carboxylate dehydrogenase